MALNTHDHRVKRLARRGKDIKNEFNTYKNTYNNVHLCAYSW